jgi:serine/threonine protein kinase
MRTGLASIRDVGGLDSVDRAVQRFEAEWRHGESNLERHRDELGAEDSVSLLAELVKSDLRNRFLHGETPAVTEYLERFPRLRDDGDRVLSLVYEEFCLLQERGDRPNADEFCAKYPEWQDSLVSQLRYHVEISRIAEASAPSPPLPEPGERFEQFEIRRELGRGSAGRVYLASEEPLGGREVALKVGFDRGQEPRILGRLAHAHIVPVHSSARQVETNLRWICMPYQPGLPLDAVIRRLNAPAESRPTTARSLWDALESRVDSHGAEPRLKVGGPGWETFPVRGSFADATAWVVATQAEALAHAHAQKVVHRDVKPPNVLLTFRHGPQLLDFNLAHDPHSAGEAKAALQGGTLPYMAPEQLEAFLDPLRWERVGARADIYSLGLLLREMLTGKSPDLPDPKLPLARAIQALYDRRKVLPPGLRSIDPRIPYALEAITQKCLSFAPADRYESASDLAEDLHCYLARKPLKHARNPSRTEQTGNWLRRNRIALAAALVVSLSALAAKSDQLLRAHEERPAFLAAVQAVEAGHAEEAVTGLEKLASEVPDSAIIQFYLRAALELTGKAIDAENRFNRLSLLPGPRAAMINWGRSHPRFAGLAASVGKAALERAPKLDPTKAADELEFSGRLFDMALAVDPHCDVANEGLAVIAEQRGDFATAEKLLDKLIATFSSPQSPAERTKLRKSYQVRARISIKSAQAILARPDSTPDARAATVEITRAVLNLGRAEELAGPNDESAHFEIRYMECEAGLVHGDILRNQGHHAEARQQYESANALLDQLSSGAQGADWFTELSDRVKGRLESGAAAPPATISTQ